VGGRWGQRRGEETIHRIPRVAAGLFLGFLLLIVTSTGRGLEKGERWPGEEGDDGRAVANVACPVLRDA